MESVDTCHDMGAAVTFASGLYQTFHQDGKDIPILSRSEIRRSIIPELPDS